MTIELLNMNALDELMEAVARYNLAWSDAMRQGRYSGTSTTMMEVSQPMYDRLLYLGGRLGEARTKALAAAFS